MSKTPLENAIENRAKERFNNEYKSLRKFLGEHPIASRLKIIFPDLEERPEFLIERFKFNHKVVAGKSNWPSVEAEMVEAYAKEETENLLKKIDALKDFFETATENL